MKQSVKALLKKYYAKNCQEASKIAPNLSQVTLLVVPSVLVPLVPSHRLSPQRSYCRLQRLAEIQWLKVLVPQPSISSKSNSQISLTSLGGQSWCKCSDDARMMLGWWGVSECLWCPMFRNILKHPAPLLSVSCLRCAGSICGAGFSGSSGSSSSSSSSSVWSWVWHVWLSVK